MFPTTDVHVLLQVFLDIKLTHAPFPQAAQVVEGFSDAPRVFCIGRCNKLVFMQYK